MNHHELKNFLTLAELLHFGKASEVCHLSASALTRSIQRLELEIDQQLFVRDNRSVRLTRAGEVFREYAAKAVRDWEAMREELSKEETLKGAVSIYASVTAVYSLLPDLLGQYRSLFPEVQIELHTGVAEAAIERLVLGEIDMVVAALPDRQLSRVEFLPLLETKLIFVKAKKHSIDLNAEPRRRPDDEQVDLKEAALVLPNKGLARARVDQWLKKQGAYRNQITEVSGNEGILAMVRLGCGVGVVPELVLERSPFKHELEVVEMGVDLEPYVVGLCASKANLQRPSVAALWSLAMEQG